MVTYNPKDWIRLVLQFHKSDTIRILFPAMMLIGTITAAVTIIEQLYISKPIQSNITIFHQISGFIISLVLVFRINSAYDRWWEGRKLWGSLLNNSRNLAIKFNAIVPKQNSAERQEIHAMIANYAYTLKEHLRGNTAPSLIIKSQFLSNEEYSIASHKPNFIAKQLTKLALNICEKTTKTQNDYLIISENLSNFIEICGACERIKTTPIPYSYSIFIKKIVFIYIITMPIAFGLSAGYWSIPIVIIMFYAFASLEIISEEIEDPFGGDENDLPTDEIAEKIKLNSHEILLP
jgi:putative membrane protein